MATAELVTDAGELNHDAANDLIDQQLAALHDEQDTTEKIVNDDVGRSPGEEKKETPRSSDEKSPKDEASKEVNDEPASDDGDDWVSAQDVQELIESFGYTKEDLEQFGSREALDQHVKLMDRQFMADGKPGESEETDDSEGEPNKEGGKPRDKKTGRFTPKDPDPEEGDFEVKLDPEEYEEDLISEIKRSHDTLLAKLQESEARVQSMLDERLAKQEAQFADADKAAAVQHFDQVVDQLELREIFGTGEQLTDDEFKARSRLWDAAATLIDGMAKNGKSATLSAGLVRRALNMEFADQLKAKEQRNFNSKVRKQAGRKLGNSSNKASIEKEYDGDIRQNPELHAAYNALLEQSGAL